ncbi:MAG: 1-deoxy-D-xylulose-5-phosphate reductoisomerase [Alphaproteobacteria bacterium]|nr:1-deoxy-D-xylulose-5-phosphate reductoisomerase [Alphaproteobacteria bacterium]MCZ6840723.1 1-deoxy-D-xylulose-5-phosphate reductoisomerase [Alphaproteobacteria bacterium]
MALTNPEDLTQTAVSPRTVTVLGATGSVGCNTVDLLARNRDRFRVVALTANSNVALLAEQARLLEAKFAIIGDPEKLDDLRDALQGTEVEVMAGEAAVIEAASQPADIVVAAIVGAAGLRPTLAASRQGSIVAIANKECLVCAGELVMAEVERSGTTLLPVDSEHNAIFQVFETANAKEVERLILTASGGPFRTWTLEELAVATPAQAVAHPNWDMGRKISVDSATLMNKGLELIEAAYLFPVPAEKIEVLVHPQSVVHSLVAYIDGSVLAQLGTPDMRTPIAYTLSWPERMAAPAKRLDLAEIGELSFEAPDLQRFPALNLARNALTRGNGSTAILNAANEVAVASFLDEQIGFLDITRIVEETLDRVPAQPIASFDDFEQLDAEARRIAQTLVKSRF